MFRQVLHFDLDFEVAIQNGCQLVFLIGVASVLDELLLIGPQIVTVGSTDQGPFDIKRLDHLDSQLVIIGLLKQLLILLIASVDE